MYQYKGLDDTIAAMATGAGGGGIGIIRMSGQEAIAIADSVVRLQGGKLLKSSPSHTVHYGRVIDVQSGADIDEVLVVLMRSPKSYTTQDVVEINCHGGMTVQRAVLQAVLSAGARLALPGEFTKRAFLYGRLDLTQAEAVIDIIQAKTETFLRQSQHQLKGELSSQLNQMREELTGMYTTLEALINFPEDGIDAQSREQLLNRISHQEQGIAKLLESSTRGRILKEGIRIVLCGRPNVGKSSLLNALLKEQRAIVTPIAGTTRDVLEESMHLQGVPIALVDTAGILEPRDLVEQEAVARSHLYIKSADVVLLVLDHSRPLDNEDLALIEQVRNSRVLAVVNKIDLDRQIDLSVLEEIFTTQRMVKVSAHDTLSVEALEVKIMELIHHAGNFDGNGVLISNVRHIKALEQARKNLQSAWRLMDENTPLEFISEEIKSAVNHLDAITGRNIDEDLLDRIFAEFCIGK